MTVKATDEFNFMSQEDISLKVTNNAPVISNTENCPTTVRVDNSYSCQVSAIDPDGHDFTFSLTNTHLGLSIDPQTGEITGEPYEPASKTMTIRATDEYDNYSEASYILTVNSYCGDGEIESPNMEGQGGENNDGNEDCDGLDGVIVSYFDGNSSVDEQYSCTTQVDSECVLGSDCTGTCSATGGWCGDGICGSKDNTFTTDDGEELGVCEADCYDDDTDGDGIMSRDDNCPDISNPDQADVDGDDIGDICDQCFDYKDACVELEVYQPEDTLLGVFYPYVTAESTSEFYCYGGDCTACTDSDTDTVCTDYAKSSNIVEFAIVKSERSNIFAYIYANPSTDIESYILALGFIHDAPNDDSGGMVWFGFSGSAWDIGVTSVTDDGCEFSKEEQGTWQWDEGETDGGMLDIGYLNTSWEFNIDPSNILGINEWIAKNPGSLEDGINLNLTEPVKIKYTAP